MYFNLFVTFERKVCTHLQNILVCVTQQKTCERLIRSAVNLKSKYKSKGDLFVLHVAKNDWNFLDNAKEGEALEYLFDISKSVGANLYVLKSDNIVKTISDFARENNVTDIIMGESPEDHKENKFYHELSLILNDVQIHVISQSNK